MNDEEPSAEIVEIEEYIVVQELDELDINAIGFMLGSMMQQLQELIDWKQELEVEFKKLAKVFEEFQEGGMMSSMMKLFK